MTVDEFVAEQQKTLDDFLTFWRHGHEQNPKDFPLHMQENEWHEQFDFFDPEDLK